MRQLGAAAETTVARLRPQTPAIEANCSVASENVQTVPIRFHGNPVKAQARSHSLASQAAAKNRTRASPRSLTGQIAASAKPGNSAMPEASAPTAKGMSAPNRSASTRKEWPTQ